MDQTQIINMIMPYSLVITIAAVVAYVLTNVWTSAWGSKREAWRKANVANGLKPDPGWFDATQHLIPLIVGGLVGWAMSYGMPEDTLTVYVIGTGCVGGAFSLIIVKRMKTVIRGTAVKAAAIQKETGSFEVMDLEK